MIVEGAVRPFLFSYWITLFHLTRGRMELEKSLDLPLESAVKRAWSASGWTALWILVLLAIAKKLDFLFMSTVQKPFLWGIALILLTAGVVCFYGLFRLYILVSHVIATNIFKMRGQRLRWLNQQTAVLSLTFPIGVACLIYFANHLVGAIFLCVLGLFAAVLSTYSCQLVFHTSRLRGFLLFVKLNIVSLFVTFICAFAFIAAFFMICLIFIAIIRVFIH